MDWKIMCPCSSALPGRLGATQWDVGTNHTWDTWSMGRSGQRWGQHESGFLKSPPCVVDRVGNFPPQDNVMRFWFSSLLIGPFLASFSTLLTATVLVVWHSMVQSFYPAQDSSLRCSLPHAAWRVASQLLLLTSKPSVLLIDSVSAWQGAQVVPRSSYLLHMTSIKSFYFKGRRRKVSDFLNYNNLPKQVFLPNTTHFPIKMLSTHCSLLLFELS